MSGAAYDWTHTRMAISKLAQTFFSLAQAHTSKKRPESTISAKVTCFFF